jgi:hypothetical protein
VIENAGHVVTLEQTAQVLEAITSFLSAKEAVAAT